MFEYEYEYLIISWVRVLVDEFEYENEYRPMICIVYTAVPLLHFSVSEKGIVNISKGILL